MVWEFLLVSTASGTRTRQGQAWVNADALGGAGAEICLMRSSGVH